MSRVLDQISALRYVTAENAPNYRAIVQVFAEARERYEIELRPSDVRDRLARSGLHHDLRGDADLDRHLDQLADWGNLQRRHLRGAAQGGRGRLLGEDERRLIEEFLSGEAHGHLAARLREARGLVERMNAAIERRTTASGSQVRLVWEVDAEHVAAKDAVALFLRAGHLLSEANREVLKRFLHEKLDAARQAESATPLQDRMVEALDYRPWHRFVVQHRTPGQAWAPLTRKSHAAGSGGKKAVMLHLPLFAAAAAFYDAAQPGAPRLIALDEAFAGIDRPMRGQLMGLLAEFDLDFVMTSYEEWGFYAELDGLSTYHLARDPSMRGVHAEWFLWDGREQVLVEDA